MRSRLHPDGRGHHGQRLQDQAPDQHPRLRQRRRLRLVPVSKFSLEGCLEFLAPDELLEVTPENLRIRKRILDHDLRMKAASKKNK